MTYPRMQVLGYHFSQEKLSLETHIRPISVIVLNFILLFKNTLMSL
jgi:hypothetical protein